MMGEWNTKCSGCKKMLPISEFNDIDFGYGVYHKANSCKTCVIRNGKLLWEQNKKWLELQEKTWGDKPKMKGWNEVGEVWILMPNGSLVVECEGFVQTEEYKKEEMKKLAYPFGWARI